MLLELQASLKFDYAYSLNLRSCRWFTPGGLALSIAVALPHTSRRRPARFPYRRCSGYDEILRATIGASHSGEMISVITRATNANIGLKKVGAAIHPYWT